MDNVNRILTLLTDDIENFIGMVKKTKDEIMDYLFEYEDEHIFPELTICKYENYLICITNEIGYVVKWNKRSTILLYQKQNVLKAKLYRNQFVIAEYIMSTTHEMTIYTLLSDMYELENSLKFISIQDKTLEKFIF